VVCFHIILLTTIETVKTCIYGIIDLPFRTNIVKDKCTNTSDADICLYSFLLRFYLAVRRTLSSFRYSVQVIQFYHLCTHQRMKKVKKFVYYRQLLRFLFTEQQLTSLITFNCYSNGNKTDQLPLLFYRTHSTLAV
jgi:hypothetical protein